MVALRREGWREVAGAAVTVVEVVNTDNYTHIGKEYATFINGGSAGLHSNPRHEGSARLASFETEREWRRCSTLMLHRQEDGAA